MKFAFVNPTRNAVCGFRDAGGRERELLRNEIKPKPTEVNISRRKAARDRRGCGRRALIKMLMRLPGRGNPRRAEKERKERREANRL
jgi:hypothetical protein